MKKTIMYINNAAVGIVKFIERIEEDFNKPPKGIIPLTKENIEKYGLGHMEYFASNPRLTYRKNKSQRSNWRKWKGRK